MQDKTINSALLELRKRIIQGNGDGLAHVEALLRQRGVQMRNVPRIRMKATRSGLLTYMILEALKDGPQTARYVSHRVSERRPELGFDKAHIFASRPLTKLKKRGLVAHDGKFGGLWSAVQDFGPDGCLWWVAIGVHGVH